ncbi:MAG: AmmeMemoRadiSam system protein A [Candidatus Thiodiazotropha sp. (ex Dulcina madagascariensis)]|nr:AmmeMemoRadiSam system protein A [Candidatus Thiodiazotropha sp. (ex Dulcina madagascariensis)]
MNHHNPSQLSEIHRNALLEIARRSIEHGLEQGAPLPVAAGDYPAELQALRASFVTLMREDSLRGCIGHLEAQMPLLEDVAENAYSAAFRDPRFPPLSSAERKGLEIHISVLTPAEPLTFSSEEELIRKIRPSVDGLILVEGAHRGTFLPSVWEALPDTRSFLRHLKQKAGLPGDYWSESLEVHRYETESFS